MSKYYFFLLLLTCSSVAVSAMNPNKICFKITQDDKICFFKSKDGKTYQLDIETLLSLGDRPSFLALSSNLVVYHEEVRFEDVDYVVLDFELHLDEFRQTVKDPNLLYKEMTVVIEQNAGIPKFRAEFLEHDLDINEIVRRIREEKKQQF